MSDSDGLFRSIDLGGGLRLHHRRTRTFQTITARLALHADLDDHTAARALVPRVLARGTRRLPSLREVQVELDRLFGASLTGDTRKMGERHVVQFRAEWIPDRLAGEPLVDRVADLLAEMLHDPAVDDSGGLREAIVAQERKNQVDEIAAIYDDKARFAQQRLIEEMCRGERYARSALGRIDEVRACDPAQVTAAWRALVDRAPADLFVVGPLTLREAQRFARRLGLHRRERIARPRRTRRSKARRPRTVREHQDIRQARLSMGYRLPTRAGLEDYAGLVVFNALFGGSAVGTLFREVRERHSLCYAIGSRPERAKGLLLVHAGIDAKHERRVRRLVARQLEHLREGRLDAGMFEMARGVVHGALATVRDSAGGMCEFGLERAIQERPADLDGLLAAIAAVTPRDVARMARKAELDTVYVLAGQGGDA